MTRRDFIKMTSASMALGSMPHLRSIPSEASSRPNVLFIAIDDLNDWIGCMGGHPQAYTPNIDALAKKGVLFSNAHCSAPVCNPSRASVLTGILPSDSGIYYNRPLLRDKEVPEFARNAVTLPQYFMNNGYDVVTGGKIFHWEHDQKSSRSHYPSWQENKPKDPAYKSEYKNAHAIPSSGGRGSGVYFGPLPAEIGDEDMGDWKVASWAIGEMNKKHDRPFFIGAGLRKPHMPWLVPQKYFERFPLKDIILPKVKWDDLDDVPRIGKKMARKIRKGGGAGSLQERIMDRYLWKDVVQSYLATTAFVDAQVGRLIKGLEDSQYADNTVVVLWSDHGFHLGEKLYFTKKTLWEESTRNILFFSYPGMKTAGTECSRTTSLMDIYPTLNELCGLPKKDGIAGNSLKPLLDDPKRKWQYPALTTYGRNNHSIRSERWRYIRYKDGTEELYDHSKDTNEWHNLADKPQHKEVKNKLAMWIPKKNAPALGKNAGKFDD